MNTQASILVSITYDTGGHKHDHNPWVIHAPGGELIRRRSYASAKTTCADCGWTPILGPLPEPTPETAS